MLPRTSSTKEPKRTTNITGPLTTSSELRGGSRIPSVALISCPIIAGTVLNYTIGPSSSRASFWECQERTPCEMFLDQLPKAATYNNEGLGKSLDAGFHSQNHRGPIQPSQYSFWMWDRLVVQYMKCAITNPLDKLICHQRPGTVHRWHDG